MISNCWEYSDTNIVTNYDMCIYSGYSNCWENNIIVGTSVENHILQGKEVNKILLGITIK